MNLRLKLILFLILSFRLFSEVNAQSNNVIWAKQVDGFGFNNVIASSNTIDSHGNSYITGYFGGAADFDPGPGIVNLTAVGWDDIFIQKLDSAGNFVWVKQIGGQNLDHSNSITLDTTGNIYVAGFFEDTVDFDPGAGVFELRGEEFHEQLFILKLDAAGNFIWAKSTPGIGYSYANCIKIDNEENVIINGIFSQTADFDSDSSNSFFLTSAGWEDIFILKLDSNGNFLWVKAIGGSGNDFGSSIAIENDNDICVTGVYSANADFYPDTSGVLFLNNEGAFILKLDKNAQFKWVRSLTGHLGWPTFSMVTQNMPIAIDNSGNIISAGLFENPADFDPGTDTFLMECSNNYPDLYILKLDSNGNFIWAKSIPGGLAEEDRLGLLALDQFNNISILGSFGDTCDFNPGAGEYALISQGGLDIFILKLDSFGNFVSVKSFGGINHETGTSIAIDNFGNSFICGHYLGNTLVFDAIILTNTSSMSTNLYIAKLACTTESVINVNSCESYISPSGNIFYNSGIYNDTIYSGGCLSTFIINLTITTIDTSITQSGATLISNSINCTYRWLNCDNGFHSIFGATNQTYTPTSSGNYTIEINMNGCKDTSACYYVLVNGLSDINYTNFIKLFPDPAHDKLAFEILSGVPPDEIEIDNSLGVMVMKFHQSKSLQSINIHSLCAGIYFVKMRMNDGSLSMGKFVKE